MKTRTITTGVFYRASEVDTTAIDTEARTVPVRFSSEYPVTRFIDGDIGDEVLDHSPESVNLERLLDGGPVLMDHDSRDHVGVVEAASIQADRVGRAVLRFGSSQRAIDVFNDIVDGIRRSVSVGYVVHRYEREGKRGDYTFRAKSWEPYEITMTAVPADPSAQVGRSNEFLTNTEVTDMETEEETTVEQTRAAPVVDVQGEIDAARKGEVSRVSNIRKMGEKFNCADLAQRAIDSGWSVDVTREKVMDAIAARAEQELPPTHLGLTGKEVRGYSLIKAVRAVYNGNDWSDAGLELEASRAIADQLGVEPQGFFVPFEIQRAKFSHQHQERVMTVGSDTAGGHLVGTDHLAGSFIELLRANALATQLGATVLPGLVGDVDIPRLDGGATFGWVTEDADGSESDGLLGVLNLSPKTVTAHVPISRRLLKQSAPSVEQIMLEDMGIGAGLAIDLAFYEGSGAAGQPTGIVNTAGIGTTTIASAAAPTFPEMVAFETDLSDANALLGNPAYVTTSPIRGHMKTAFIDPGSGLRLMMNGEVNGYPARVSTQLSTNRIVFGDHRKGVIGMWGVLDVYPDRAAKAASGGLVLRVFQDCDIGVRHVGAFSINA